MEMLIANNFNKLSWLLAQLTFSGIMCSHASLLTTYLDFRAPFMLAVSRYVVEEKSKVLLMSELEPHLLSNSCILNDMIEQACKG